MGASTDRIEHRPYFEGARDFFEQDVVGLAVQGAERIEHEPLDPRRDRPVFIARQLPGALSRAPR